jgi:transposase
LLLLVAQPEGAERERHLRWSQWRRQHQAVACRGHRARRAQRPPPAQPGLLLPGAIPISLVPGTAELTAGLWQQVASLVAPHTPPQGRPSGDLRRQVEGMLAVMHTGVPWREVPPACGPWHTIYTRYRTWVTSGLWDRIAAILHPDTSQERSAAPP